MVIKEELLERLLNRSYSVHFIPFRTYSIQKIKNAGISKKTTE
jgi:hypothetical protein